MDTIRGGSFFVNCVNQTVLVEISALKNALTVILCPKNPPAYILDYTEMAIA